LTYCEGLVGIEVGVQEVNSGEDISCGGVQREVGVTWGKTIQSVYNLTL